MSTIIKMPDLGDIESAEIIEVLVKVGDIIEKETPICVVESDKASMEVPASDAGTISSLHFTVGDKLSSGDKLVTIESNSAETEQTASSNEKASKSISAPSDSKKEEAQNKASSDSSSSTQENHNYDYDVIVLGSGPGGYAAAFRAADLGLNVAIVEKYPILGGVCLNVGCIPSKALLHVAEIINEAKEADDFGVKFSAPTIDIDAIRSHKDNVINKMTGGLAQMAKMRKVTVITGVGTFKTQHSIDVSDDSDGQTLSFNHAIIAAGSRVVKLPFFPWDDPRIMDSTDALELTDVPENILIVGGGIIGLEMGTVFSALGSKVDIVELTPSLMAGADADLVRTYTKFNKNTFENIYVNTEVTAASAEASGITITFKGDKAPTQKSYDKVLVAVGRRPNSDQIGAENLAINIDERGFIQVDKQMRTNINNIFAIGDIVGQPMLAHKATHEGHVAAEVIAGEKTEFVATVIPAVAYTDPEVAWVGLTENQAKEQGIKVEKAVFPWAASGRATSIARSEGFTKLIFDPETDRILGGAVIGVGAGDLIGEIGLAIEMHADAHDIGLTIHPHPTLTETVGLAAETYLGSVTDLIARKRKN